ncbi:membrane protein FxsA [Halalkalibacillus sediminis]|uniref:Membrane protein FxsA n=1 Tax=Halalkalibacillus sediminis TaxID=2018042 RepID=A0A2I0QY81_9BACI|nr:FxsA family protein [Halalkalibacillus sediminis]PKR79268.1 membrane protein FxsA [Halalkalibacillus sediminis]
MFRILFILIIVVSAIEIAIFVSLGNAFNVWIVLFGIILTGLAGAFLAKQQGLGTLNRARFEMSNSRVPTEEIFDGIAILVGAVLLFTPGFLTDTIGFLLLIPPTRRPAKQWAKKTVQNMVKSGKITVFRR